MTDRYELLVDPPRVCVTSSTLHGRGVVAVRPARAGDVLDISPVLVLPAEEREALDATSLHDHYYEWDDDGSVGVAMGTLAFVNHSSTPNAHYERHEHLDALFLVADVDIADDEEVTVDYTGGGGHPLWFTPKG